MVQPPSAKSSTADYSFGPKRRVKRRVDFLRIQGAGKKFQSRHFLLIVAPNKAVAGGGNSETQPTAPEMRFGATITTKVDKRAARRNRLRRRLRECFRLIRPQLVGPPSDIVVIARNGSVDISFDQIRREFHYLLYQSKLLPSKRTDKAKPGSRKK